jgi:hypothetical protein
MNTDPSIVPKAMVDALTASQPKYRYRVGLDSKWIFTPLSKLHESWQDWFFNDLLGKKTVPPAAAPKDGKGIAKGRMPGDPVPWYLAGAVAVSALSKIIASKL